MKQLNDMGLFVEVVKAMNFRRAAEVLGMPSSTLSRRISALEKAIGLRLLHRTTRKIELTEAGQVYFERCKRIVEEARLAHEQLGDMLAQPSGVLRVSLPVDFSVTYLAPLIAEFARQFPLIDFDLNASPRNVDLVGEPFDVAIRMGEPVDSLLIARPLASLSTHIYASPDYIEQKGEPKQPADLSHHECLYMLKANTWLLHDDTQSHHVAVSSRFMLNSMGMVRRFAALGMGVAILPAGIAADDVAHGLLQQVLPEWRGASIPVYALTETRLLPAKVLRFIEFLRLHLAAQPA
ncbi:HTH-type transcriptional regulator DmlR [Ephemeroptericola cinctiostellae]|uniref:HTH-type transcriptional regulator DmlR n=1 Tax=Ephemeroptericola cinctiostellae TaxID=2268024 RepID=A0A345DBN2_9BURK|nr:LysR family transcriptional regulator [Ephemeroptericola cinctiostellae]AXF85770.1 HTH-type transcriptional regulator DmlR [Ephemeroptericola cinctiostellae]